MNKNVKDIQDPVKFDFFPLLISFLGTILLIFVFLDWYKKANLNEKCKNNFEKHILIEDIKDEKEKQFCKDIYIQLSEENKN